MTLKPLLRRNLASVSIFRQAWCRFSSVMQFSLKRMSNSVSTSDSPLDTLEPLAVMETESAPSRLAAISKLVRVRKQYQMREKQPVTGQQLMPERADTQKWGELVEKYRLLRRGMTVIDWGDLQHFLAVAESGSVGGAAQRLAAAGEEAQAQAQRALTRRFADHQRGGAVWMDAWVRFVTGTGR